VAEDQPGKQSPTRRRTTTSKPGTAKPTKPTTPTKGSGGSTASTPGSSATDPAGALDLEPDTFAAPGGPVPADTETDLDPYEPVGAEPIEWTPERASAVVRAGGYLLHTADGLTREPGGEELWRATEADLEAIAPPLARILNRYEPARRLAGLSDEGELAFGVAGYVRRNLAARGRILTAQKEAAELADQTPTWPAEQPPETDG
jgi:hypothetical protein